jgi:hypothetical protein
MFVYDLFKNFLHQTSDERASRAKRDKMLISGLWKIRFLCSCYVGDEKEKQQNFNISRSHTSRESEHKSRVNHRNVKAT